MTATPRVLERWTPTSEQIARANVTAFMRELGVDPSAVNIDRHYGDLINGLVIDAIDSDSMQAVSASGVAVLSTQTVMRTAQDRVDLARDCLAFIDDLLRRKA